LRSSADVDVRFLAPVVNRRTLAVRPVREEGVPVPFNEALTPPIDDARMATEAALTPRPVV
jgi:hypothetical protein